MNLLRLIKTVRRNPTRIHGKIVGSSDSTKENVVFDMVVKDKIVLCVYRKLGNL